MSVEIKIEEEKIFKGKKVYFSGPIHGVPHPDPTFFADLVGYMKDGGALVFSEHVAIQDSEEERNRLFLRNSGIGREYMDEIEAAMRIREAALAWVDEAEFLVAIVDTPSDGSSTEIHEAVRKHKMGMNLTPVLCLCHIDNWKYLSNMIKGIGPKDSPVAYVTYYTDTEDAKKMIKYFLTSH